MKARILLKKLRELGFSPWRTDGRHIIYGEPGGRSVAIPNHREINEITAMNILKDATEIMKERETMKQVQRATEACVYPAVLCPNGDGYTVRFPDLRGCITEGYTLADALDMAQEALSLWTGCQLDHGQELPPPTDLRDVAFGEDELATLIWATPNRENESAQKQEAV